MSEFIDGLRDPDYEGLASDYLPLDVMDPSVAFDVPWELQEPEPPSRTPHVMSRRRIKELQCYVESDDPKFAALGHFGLANLVHIRRQKVAEKRAYAREIIPPMINGNVGEPDHPACMAGKWYLALVTGLMSPSFDKQKGTISNYLVTRVQSVLRRESLREMLISPGNRAAFGKTAHRLSSFYDYSYLDQDDDFAIQATRFYTYYDDAGPDFMYPKLPEGEVANDDRQQRLAALRNVMLHPMGEPLADEFDIADDRSVLAFEDADIRVDLASNFGEISELFASAKLTDRQHNAIIMRFGLDGNQPMTLKAIGESLDGITGEAVRQNIAAALKKLRAAANALRSQSMHPKQLDSSDGSL